MTTNFAIQERKNITSTTNRSKKILNAKYKKANLKEIINKFKYLNSNEKLLIYTLMKKHENITLGNNTGIEYKIELLEGAQLYHAKPFPIPKVCEETLKTEVNI